MGADLRDYYEPAQQTDSAIGFMRQNRDRPFACYLSWGPPHTPFRPPRDFRRYAAEEITLRPNVPQDHGEQARKDLAGYYGLCESLDHEIGRIAAFPGGVRPEREHPDGLLVRPRRAGGLPRQVPQG